MSEEEKEETQKEGHEQKPMDDRYGLLCILSFAMLISSLFTASAPIIKMCLIWMFVLRSYGLLVKKMKREWLAVILYGSGYVYYATQIYPTGIL
jgi:hypothetical protein